MAKTPRSTGRPIGLKNDPESPLRGNRHRKRDPSQPQLSLDPMPSRVDPCLALMSLKAPEGPNWAYEIKWDGYRVSVHVELGGRVRVLTRGGHDWTHRFPGIAAAALALGPATMILDGEAVLLDGQGRSDFNALVRSLGGRGGRLASRDIVLYAFDILYLDGHDLSSLDLSERRMLLDPLLEGSTGTIRLSEMIEADGASLLASACSFGLEGIIAKRLDSRYRSGRGGEWRKIKCVQSDTFLIVGYEPSASAPGLIASLLLGAYKGDHLVYVGSVGTGFKASVAGQLKIQLDRIQTKSPATGSKRKKAVFVEPRLAAEIEYRGWTGEGKLRHASFKGLRDEEDHVEIYQVDEQ